MQDIINTGNAYQGQLKASTVDGGFFQAGHDYFIQISNMTQGQLDYIKRLGIYWDKPGDRRMDATYTPLVQLKPIDSNNLQKFEIGYNNMLEFRDIKVNGITFTHDSSSKCFIDFIGVLKESN